MKTHFRIGFLCLICLPFMQSNRLQAQIWGNPGSNVNLPCSTPGCNFDWTFNSCSSDLSIVGATNLGNLTVHIADNTSCCDADIDGEGDDCDDNDVSCSGTLLIVPHLSAPGSVAACSSFNVNVQSGGSNGLNCNTEHGCGSSSVSGWSVSGGGASCSPCSGNVITVYTQCNLNPITISATYNCNGAHSISPITVNVVPPSPTITGSTSVGCGSNPAYVTSNQLTYSASNPSGLASYWVWTVPSGMSIVGSPNGQSIVVNVTGPVSGNVSVQAFDTNGGLGSAVVNKAVNICCTPFINETTTLNSGNTGYQVEAGSTINSTNDLQSTGTATMHAAVEVHLMPGFNAAMGCQAHFYNAACSSGFFRLAQPEEQQPVVRQDNASPVSSTDIMNVSPSVYLKRLTKPSSLQVSGKKRDFQILPNPTSDQIFVQLGEGSELPEEITVYDPTGRLAFRTSGALQSRIAIDISNMANGVYAVKVRYRNEVKSKLVVKN